MSTLFFLFTMYKPYLLYLYDLRQSLQFIKKTLETCLNIDIKRTKQRHPQISKQEVFQHITKYKLLTFIRGTPQWHKTQVQDLLAMVEQFEMPHFFLILQCAAHQPQWLVLIPELMVACSGTGIARGSGGDLLLSHTVASSVVTAMGGYFRRALIVV